MPTWLKLQNFSAGSTSRTDFSCISVIACFWWCVVIWVAFVRFEKAVHSGILSRSVAIVTMSPVVRAGPCSPYGRSPRKPTEEPNPSSKSFVQFPTRLLELNLRPCCAVARGHRYIYEAMYTCICAAAAPVSHPMVAMLSLCTSLAHTRKAGQEDNPTIRATMHALLQYTLVIVLSRRVSLLILFNAG